MRKIPFIIMAIGFAFTYYSIPFMGIDLLIDAVGYLFIFNGLWVFRLQGTRYTLGALCAFALVIIAAFPLLFSSFASQLFILLRYAFDFILLVLLAFCFVPSLVAQGRRQLLVLCLIVFALNALVAPALSGGLFPLSRSIVEWMPPVIHAIFILMLLGLALLPEDAPHDEI